MAGHAHVAQLIQATSAKTVAQRNQLHKQAGHAHVVQPTQETSAKTVALKANIKRKILP